ncbi:hypothetical protein ACFX2G_044103 [Malus domestica]
MPQNVPDFNFPQILISQKKEEAPSRIFAPNQETLILLMAELVSGFSECSFFSSPANSISSISSEFLLFGSALLLHLLLLRFLVALVTFSDRESVLGIQKV